MKNWSKMNFMILMPMMIVVMTGAASAFALEKGNADEEILAEASKTVQDQQGEVAVTVQWLRRPGEFALIVDYYGYLTQEGHVNLYLSINGVKREFVTMPIELPDRHQRIKILSFHPMCVVNGTKMLRKLNDDEMVDYLLFKNAPYYPEFGALEIEMKFFAHGRWDGDGNNNDDNYRFVFSSPIAKTNVPIDHF